MATNYDSISFPDVLGVNFKSHPEHFGLCAGDNGTIWSRYEPYSGNVLSDKWYQINGYPQYGVLRTKLNPSGIVAMIGQLVLETFVGPRPTEKHIVGYLDDNKLNNSLTNLKWVTRSESYQHKINVIGFDKIDFPNIPEVNFAFIPGTKDLYCVSDNGRIFSRKKPSGKVVNEWIEREVDRKGLQSHDKQYEWILLSIDGKDVLKSVHVTMLESFVGSAPSPKHVGRHKDDNGLNNVLSNLEWGTHRENAFDRSRNGKCIGEGNGLSKLTNESVVRIRELRSRGMTLKEIVDTIDREFGIRVNKSTVNKICTNQAWIDRSNIDNLLFPFLRLFPNQDEAFTEFVRISEEYYRAK